MANVEYLRSSRERMKAHQKYLEDLDWLGEQENEKSGGYFYWSVYDSPLSSGEKNSIGDTFRPVVPGRLALRTFIMEEFANQRGELVGIELGGSGSQCFADFPKGLFKLSAGVTLKDLRNENARKQDEDRHHHVVEFDVTSPLLEQVLKKKLGIDKFDVILERMEGGLRLDVRDPYFLYQVGNNWYQILQCPTFLHKILPQWVLKVNETTTGTIETKYLGRKRRNYAFLKGSLWISKREGAPGNLPFLTPRELKAAFTT